MPTRPPSQQTSTPSSLARALAMDDARHHIDNNGRTPSGQAIEDFYITKSMPRPSQSASTAPATLHRQHPFARKWCHPSCTRYTKGGRVGEAQPAGSIFRKGGLNIPRKGMLVKHLRSLDDRLPVGTHDATRPYPQQTRTPSSLARSAYQG